MFARLVILLMSCLVTVSAALAQAASLSATMDVHVFPSQGQDEVQQSMDEAECYNWAAERTGTDPFELSRQADEQLAASEQAMAQAGKADEAMQTMKDRLAKVRETETAVKTLIQTML